MLVSGIAQSGQNLALSRLAKISEYDQKTQSQQKLSTHSFTDEFKKFHGQIARTQIRLLLYVRDYAEETQSMATFVNSVVC